MDSVKSYATAPGHHAPPGYALPNCDQADVLAAVLALARTPTPTAAQAAAALAVLYPHGHGHTVADLLAAGLLEPTPDGHRLREPPLALAEQAARLAAGTFRQVWREVPAASPVGFTEQAPPANSVDCTELAAGPELKPSGVQMDSVSALTVQERATDFSPSGVNNPAPPRFSYYRGGIATTTPHAAVTPAQLWAVLVSPRQRPQTEALRAAPVGSPERAALKKRLDYVTPAGTFTRRANAALETPSGLLVLDFDHLPDVAAARAALLADELLADELVLLFVSPSGDGLKALVTADPTAAHLDNFRAYAAYLGGHYAALGLVPDEAGKDVARACFVPHDPAAWLAPAHALQNVGETHL